MAMVSGGINEEIIYVNDYSDTVNTLADNKGLTQFNAINRVRDLICKGKISEAELLLRSKTDPCRYNFFPMAKIRIQSDFTSRISKYRRELRLDKAVHKLNFCTKGRNYSRESFVSGFAQVFVMRISCDSPKSVSFTISLENDKTDEKSKVFMLGNTVCVYGNVKEKNISGLTGLNGETDNTPEKQFETAFLGILSVKSKGGTVSYIDNSIRIDGADEAIIYFSIRTKLFELKKNYNFDYNDFYKQCFADVYNAQKLPYFDLINKSILEHKTIYEKSSVSLDDEKYGRVATDVRLKRHLDGQADYALYPLMYNIGKYFAIICSQYTTNLDQIIRTDDMLHIDNGTNMNKKVKFWPIYPCGLFVEYRTFLRLCQKYYLKGKTYAKEKYNIDGWLYNYLDGNFADLKLKYSNSEELNFWRVCSGWMSLILWKYYTYNSDLEYLKEIYPIISDAASAFRQMLVKKGDYYILPPSAFINFPKSSEEPAECSITIQSTVYYLFSAVSKAQDKLKMKNEYSDLLPLIKRESFPIKGIKCDSHDESLLDEYSLHVMQLSGAYDFERYSDVRERIHNKISKHGDLTENICTIGWRVSMCASLHDGEKALEFLDKQLYMAAAKSGILDIYDFYTRFVTVNPAYAIYSNMAVCGGILNMLIDIGDDGTLNLLPAIPEKWPNGKVTDVRIPGNKKISFSWENGKVNNYKIEDINQ